MVTSTFTPGSDAALDQGCACPVLDNAHGLGWLDSHGQQRFWINGNCSLHGAAVRANSLKLIRAKEE